MSTSSLNIHTVTIFFSILTSAIPFNFYESGHLSRLLDKPDKILETAAYKISLPTIKTLMSGNTL